MEPIINKLREGVKYPRFERDATTIINDLVDHITKERGVYSSSIEPNPNEHKVWFNTNDDTLNIYENGKWNPIGRKGGSIGDVTLSGETITGNANINLSLNGFISDVTVKDSYFTDAKYIRMGSGAIIEMTPTSSIKNGNIESSTIKNATITGNIIASGATISDATFNGAIFTGYINGKNTHVISMIISTGCTVKNSTIRDCTLTGSIDASGATISGATISGGTLTGIFNASGASINKCQMTSPTIANPTIIGGVISGVTINGTINAKNSCINSGIISGGYISGGDIEGAYISGATISNSTFGSMNISTGSNITYASSKVLLTYTGSEDVPILIPDGGNIGYDSASLTLCGVTLTGGDFTKLKNLQ